MSKFLMTLNYRDCTPVMLQMYGFAWYNFGVYFAHNLPAQLYQKPVKSMMENGRRGGIH